MTNKLTKQLILLIFLNLQACASIAENTYHCPKKIYANSKIVNVPDSWKAQETSTHHFLTSSTFSDGHPSNLGFLRPSKIIEGQGTDMAEYNLSDISNDHAWLVCRYGNTPSIIFKKMPSKFSTCTVSLPKNTTEQRVACNH